MGFTSSRRVGIQARAQSVVDMAGLLMASGGRGGSTAGQPVTTRTVATVPAIHAAWEFCATAVANLELGVYRGEGVIPERVTTSVQSRLFAGVADPRQDWHRCKYIMAKSLEARNNAYLWKTKNAAGQVIALTALHPDQVFPYAFQVRGNELVYPVIFSSFYPVPPGIEEYGMVTVDRSIMLHIRGGGNIGEAIPGTPVQQFATALGIALAKQDFEANLYANGVMGGLAVAFPANMSPEQAKKWKEVYNSENAGTTNAGRTRVIGGGATIAQIGMTLADAQFVEAGNMSLLDVANITGCPHWVLGIEHKSEKSTTPEQDDARWVNHGLETRLRRIESALRADPDIFGPGARDYPRFDTANAIHPDSRTADTIAHQQIQDGRLLVDEWRIPRGMPPLPNGMGMLPQIVPVGGSPAGVPMPANDGGSPSEE